MNRLAAFAGAGRWIPAGVLAVVLVVAGVVTWRMVSPRPRGSAIYGSPRPGERVAYFTPAPHRLHPLGAELLWVAGTACGLVAAGSAVRRR